MIRGTTPTNVFNVNLDLTNADVIYITYAQQNKPIIEKAINDIVVEPDKLTVKLTQQETLKLQVRACEIQIRARFPDGTAIASNIIQTTARKILKGGVI